MDDRELNHLLREWKAPDAPPHLKPPTSPKGKSFWTWLLTGSIRVPVPVGVAAALIVVFWLYATGRQPVAETQPASAQPVVSLADFQPVEQVEIRVVGELK
jgi:hypothetical protein